MMELPSRLAQCAYGIIDQLTYTYDGTHRDRLTPIIEQLPYLTPYNYASNDPVGRIDLYGLQGMSFQGVFNRMFSRGSTTLEYRTLGAINAATPDLNTQNRINLAGNGLKNTTFGVLGTIGSVTAAEVSGGASLSVLPLSLGEVGIGMGQIYDAIAGGNPSADAPLHRAGSLPGLLAYQNNSPNAEMIDALGQFAPGIISGGNIVGVGENIADGFKAAKAGEAMQSAFYAANAYDAFNDTKGVWDATSNFNPSGKKQEAQKIQYNGAPKTSGVLQKVDVQYSTKDVNEIKAFIENLKK